MFKHLKWLLLLVFVIIFWQCHGTGGKGTLSGKILGADGKPPVIAHVHLVEAGGDVFHPFKSVKVNKDGSFSVPLPNQKYLDLYITAAFHQQLEVPLARKNDRQSTKIDFQLESYKFKDHFDQVKITGDWNDFSFSTAQPMHKEKDGTFTFRVKPKADTVAYQLIGLLQREVSINGTQYDYLVYDHGGDYKSVLKKTDSVITIVFDPKKLPHTYNDALPKVLLKSGSLLTQDFMDIKLLMDRYLYNFQLSRLQYRQKYGTDRGFKFDFSELIKALDKKKQETASQAVKDYIDFQHVLLSGYGAQIDKSVFLELAKNVPLTDPMWSLNPQIMPFVLEKAYGSEKANELMEKVFDKIPSKTTRAFILVRSGMQAKMRHNTKKLLGIYDQLKSGYNDVYFVKYYLKMLNPEARIAVGKPIPDFSFKEMDTGKTISNKTLKGKFFIMDFWATWCKPCLGELPSMEKAYQEYKDKNFTILSLSFDRSPDAVRKFRKGKFKMPWHHVFLDKSLRNQVGDKFEVGGIPKPILVSPEGIIIAMEGELRGGHLDQTLQKFLGK